MSTWSWLLVGVRDGATRAADGAGMAMLMDFTMAAPELRGAVRDAAWEWYRRGYRAAWDWGMATRREGAA